MCIRDSHHLQAGQDAVAALSTYRFDDPELDALVTSAASRRINQEYQEKMYNLLAGRVPVSYTHLDVYKRQILLDYAHNEVSTESLLTTLRAYDPHRLVVVFGCGGNRSKLRRYGMGEICAKMADFSILTEDVYKRQRILRGARFRRCVSRSTTSWTLWRKVWIPSSTTLPRAEGCV